MTMLSNTYELELDLVLATDNELAQWQTTDPTIVLDGAVDPLRFARAAPRILWILREPNGGGPWSLCEYLRDPSKGYNRWKMTAGLLIRVSHGLLNGLPPWGDWANDPAPITDCLRDVAVININKRGGGARADLSRLARSGEDFGPFILKQIESLSPTVVIMAGTRPFVPERLRCQLDATNTSGAIGVKLNETIYLSTHHTNQRRISHQAYYDQIRTETRRLYLD